MKNLLFILILLSSSALGTVVSGTITDPQAQAWYGGTYDFQLNPPGIVYSGGVPLPSNSYHFRGVLDGSGAFSITVPDNTTLAPGGTYWRVTICSQTSSPVETTGGSKKDTCFYVDVTVSGVTQDLSSVLSSAAPTPLVNGLLTPFAYSSAELQLVINGLSPGSIYWDLNASCLKVWNGSSWNCLGGGGGSGTVTSITGLSPIVASPNPITGVGTIGCPTCVTSNPVSLTATSPIVITPSPTTGVGVISCPSCGVGTATVTSFSAGNLPPLFTSSVATPTTTPALSFALSNAAANTIFGNFSGGSAAPIYNVIGDCGDNTHALKYTGGVGIGCQTLSGGGGGASKIPFDSCNADQTLNPGNTYWRTVTYTSVAGVTTADIATWEYSVNKDGTVICKLEVPSNASGIIHVFVDLASNDTAVGHTAAFKLCYGFSSSQNINGISYVCTATQNYISTATAYANTRLDFTAASGTIGEYFVANIIQNVGGTNVNPIRMTAKVKVF